MFLPVSNNTLKTSLPEFLVILFCFISSINIFKSLASTLDESNAVFISLKSLNSSVETQVLAFLGETSKLTTSSKYFAISFEDERIMHSFKDKLYSFIHFFS